MACLQWVQLAKSLSVSSSLTSRHIEAILICTIIYYVLICNKSFFYITSMKLKFIFRLGHEPREVLTRLDRQGGEGFWSVLGELDRKCLNRNEAWNKCWRARSSARLERQKFSSSKLITCWSGVQVSPGPLGRFS